MNGHMYFFFFQAEDGIRDIGVTGVQTCALPILLGITSRLAVCQPARSSTMTACSFAGSVAANCARNSFIALAETSGSTRAKLSPVAGRTAAKRWVQV